MVVTPTGLMRSVKVDGLLKLVSPAPSVHFPSFDGFLLWQVIKICEEGLMRCEEATRIHQRPVG